MLPEINPFVVFYLYLRKHRQRILKFSVYLILSLSFLVMLVYLAGNLNIWLNMKGIMQDLDIKQAIELYAEETDVNFPYTLPEEYEPSSLNLDAQDFQAKYPFLVKFKNERVAFPIKAGKGKWRNMQNVSFHVLKMAIVENLIKARASILDSRSDEAKKFLIANILLLEAAFAREYRILWKNEGKFFNYCSGKFSGPGLNPYCFFNPEPSKILLLYRMEMHLWLVYSLSFRKSFDLGIRGKLVILNNAANLFYRFTRTIYFNALCTLFRERWKGGKFLLGGEKYRLYAALLEQGYFPLIFDFDLNHINFTGDLGYFELPVLRRAFEFYLPVIFAVEDVKKRYREQREVVSRMGSATVSFDGEEWKIIPSGYLAPILLRALRDPVYFDVSLHFLVDYWNLRKNVLKY